MSIDRRKIARFVLSLVPVLLGAAGALATGQAAPQAEAPAPAPKAAPVSRAGVARGPDEAGWWNKKIGEQLALTTAQKQKMDAQAEALGENQRNTQLKLRETREAIRKALEISAWGEARRLFAVQADVSAGLIKAQGEAQIAVLSQLTAEQLRKLATEFPTALTTPVARTRPGRAANPAPTN
jgi:Spy/CpxP family protein refolding chaperone